MTDRRITLTLTEAEAQHLHDCLREVKNDRTSTGAVWELHNMNGSLRTRIEIATAFAPPPEEDWSDVHASIAEDAQHRYETTYSEPAGDGQLYD